MNTIEVEIQPGWVLIGNRLFAENCDYVGMEYTFSYTPSIESCKAFVAKVRGFKWDGSRWIDWGWVDGGYSSLRQVIEGYGAMHTTLMQPSQ